VDDARKARFLAHTAACSTIKHLPSSQLDPDMINIRHACVTPPFGAG
jgi:hypothetical protein